MQESMVVEIEDEIRAPAARVWNALTQLRCAAVPTQVADVETTVAADGTSQLIQLADGVEMRQRLASMDDDARVIRFEMIDGKGLPWSHYHASIQVEANDTGAEDCCVVRVRGEATCEGDRTVVSAMMRDLFQLGLRKLAQACVD